MKESLQVINIQRVPCITLYTRFEAAQICWMCALSVSNCAWVSGSRFGTMDTRRPRSGCKLRSLPSPRGIFTLAMWSVATGLTIRGLPSIEIAISPCFGRLRINCGAFGCIWIKINHKINNSGTSAQSIYNIPLVWPFHKHYSAVFPQAFGIPYFLCLISAIAGSLYGIMISILARYC